MKLAMKTTESIAQDADDDVRAVAASALLPLAPSLRADSQLEALTQLHDHLWHILLDSDELSPATGPPPPPLLPGPSNGADRRKPTCFLISESV